MPRTQVIGWSLVTLLATVAVVVAISRDSATDGVSPQEASPAPLPTTHCAVKLAETSPPLPPADKPPAPESTLVLSARIPKETLAALIGKHAPVTLASAKDREVGAPGRVSYVVSRGGFDFSLQDERLWVHTPVGAEAEICKPLGPLCPTYGRCSPKLGVAVGVPLMLDAMEEGAKTSLQVHEGCSIAGFDVSSRLQSEGQKQLGGVKNRVDALLPNEERRAEWLALAAEPIALEQGCLVVRPKRVVQAPPALAEALSLRLSVRAELRIEEGCEEASESEPPVIEGVAIERGAIDDEQSDVAVVTAVPWTELALAKPLEGKPRELVTVTQAEASASSVEGGAIVLRVVLDGNVCGPTWIATRPVVRAGALTLVPLRVLSADLPESHREALFEVVRGLSLPLPPRVSAVLQALDGFEGIVEERLKRLPEDAPFAVKVSGQPALVAAKVGPEALWLSMRRRLSLSLAPP